MLGEKIAARRKQLSMTQKELSEAIGLPQSSVAAFENGTKSNLTLRTAKRLALALGCGIDYLAETWDQEAAPPPAPSPPPPRRPRGRPRKRPLAEAAAGGQP